MTERSDLLVSIVDTIADYREADLAPPSTEHVDRWIRQFDEEVQIPILREMDHVLKQTYFSRSATSGFLEHVFTTQKLVGGDPCAFFRGVHFLDIQGGGASQKEMLALFDQLLRKSCGFGLSDCGDDPHSFIYLDDAIFTGNRVRRDLEEWIADEAPASANVHVVVIATHEGSYYHRNKVDEAATAAGKAINITWWHAIDLEDRKKYTDNSDVLRPVAIPNDPDVEAYVDAMHYNPHLRNAGKIGGKGIFSCDAGRQLLEQEFLKAGVRIRQMCPHLTEPQRPLGHTSLEALGFGSLIVTFRNCPNNAPLVWWVGDPWYPLFPRKTNTDTSIQKLFENLSKGSLR
ncbi:MAG: hypothetical protein G8D90_14365 [gamma proteobacterium symbiont of Clathrolucina costata]